MNEIIRTEHIIARNTIIKFNDEVSFEEWQEFGLKAIYAEKYIQWYLGAWWNYGHKKWSREAEEFIEKIGYKKHSLKVYGWIYNAVKSSIRMDDLSFNHHQIVAPLEESEQIKWLCQAKDNNWTVAEFRKQIKLPQLEEERNKRLKNLEESTNIILKYGDALELSEDQIPDNTIDAIITDPPYPKEFIDCWDKLSEIAFRVLKPSGFCVAYSGHLHLPEIIRKLENNLIYYWQMILLHSGAIAGVQARHINTGYKPILIFQKPPFKIIDDYFSDIIKGSGREKEADEWQQSEEELEPLFDIFTKKGDIVLDPFCGTGTVLNMCIRMERRGIGFDIRKPQR